MPKTENIALNFSNSASIAPSTVSRLNGTFELPQVSYHELVSPPERPSRLQKAVVEAHIDIEPLSQKTNGLRVVATGLSAYLQERRRGQASYEDVRGPIRNKLEKQVANVRGDLYAKEDIVRKTASDKIPVERTGESIIATENYFNPNVDLAKTSREVPSISVSRSVSRSEQNQPFIDSVKPISAEKQALRMSRIELTKISKKIVFEGVPLQKIYDAHLISDRAQRRIVIAYLRGGNIQKALSRELDVRSIAYEALSGVHVHSGQSELNRNQTMPDTPKAKLQLENKNQSSDRKKFYKTDPVKRKIMLTFNQQSAALSFVVLILLILLILFW
ncbi:hypothetical protein H7171_03760 [Candidatus Saccharibacteria bacterium]|nr:hypothetical protein [Candidatus Saccharibacteria bacterium]